jgi:hypothetical protein
MPVRIIGMIGVTPPAHSATLLVIEGAISPSFIVDFAQAHEAAGFDMVLIGYTSSWAEGFLVAMHAAARTQRLSYLVAHRPGFVAPTLFARKVATFDQLTSSRVALHIITGKTDAEQEGDGDFAPTALDAPTVSWIHQTFAEHPVLVFRDQDLGANELAAFGRIFGAPRKHSLVKYRGRVLDH